MKSEDVGTLVQVVAEAVLIVTSGLQRPHERTGNTFR